MPEIDMQPGEKAIFVFLESVSLGLALTGIERVSSVNSISGLVFALFLLLSSAVVSYVGFKWPQIKSKIGIASRLERLAGNYRYRAFSILLVAFVFSGYLLIYLHSLRSDLDTYITPRVVTKDQSDALQKALLARPSESKVTIFCNVADREATEYGAGILNAMKAGAGDVQFQPVNPWDTNPPPETRTREFNNIFPVLDEGLFIRTCLVGQPANQDPRHPSPDILLRAAFDEAHIEVNGGRTAADCGRYSLDIEVARRPEK